MFWALNVCFTEALNYFLQNLNQLAQLTISHCFKMSIKLPVLAFHGSAAGQENLNPP